MFEPMHDPDRDVITFRPLRLATAMRRGLWHPKDPLRWWHRLLGRRPDLEQDDP